MDETRSSHTEVSMPEPDIDAMLEIAKSTKILTRSIISEVDPEEPVGREAFEKLPAGIQKLLEPFSHVHTVDGKKVFTANFLQFLEKEVGETDEAYEARKKKVIATNFKNLDALFKKIPKNKESIPYEDGILSTEGILSKMRPFFDAMNNSDNFTGELDTFLSALITSGAVYDRSFMQRAYDEGR